MKYLSNVSPATIEWYEQSLGWLGTESPTEAQLKDFSYANAREGPEGKKLQFSHSRRERLSLSTLDAPE